ncbi:MAG: restriction endonuclease [Chloroflexi bacterium]|nr:restriction endonuclease [Chloroflexota bacterium]
MAIPDFQTLLLPVLRFMGDGQEHSLRETVEVLAQEFNLTQEEREQLLPSGTDSVFDNRVSWARTYLTKAGLLVQTRRGYRQITPLGKEVLARNPSALTVHDLGKFPGFEEFRRSRETGQEVSPPPGQPPDSDRTPEEKMGDAYQEIRRNLAEEILQKVKGCSPSFFERLVVDLLVKMGYGGTRYDAGQAVGRSGDGGIDGIIKEDRLGLDVIYIQAKRWENSVGSPEIHRFAGALLGKRAQKGVFITTSTFTREAREYANSSGTNIVLIDGETLANLMIDHNVGVAITSTYELKRLDSDYFEE